VTVKEPGRVHRVHLKQINAAAQLLNLGLRGPDPMGLVEMGTPQTISPPGRVVAREAYPVTAVAATRNK